MSDSVNNLSHKFELRGYTVYFNLKDSLAAEDLLDSLDRAAPYFKQVFNSESEPQGTFCILDDTSEVESILGIPGKTTEPVSFNSLTNTFCIILNNLGHSSCGETGVKGLGHLIFDKAIKEREIRMRQLRTPAWLREGLVLQIAYKIRHDSIEWLQYGWDKLRLAQKNRQLFTPTQLLKDLRLIREDERRRIAHFQSYYMVKLLLTIYCDNFFSKYSTLMSALPDMESEECFRQITSFNYEKFFSLFDNWVPKNNAWSAMD